MFLVGNVQSQIFTLLANYFMLVRELLLSLLMMLAMNKNDFLATTI